MDHIITAVDNNEHIPTIHKRVNPSCIPRYKYTGIMAERLVTKTIGITTSLKYIEMESPTLLCTNINLNIWAKKEIAIATYIVDSGGYPQYRKIQETGRLSNSKPPVKI